MFETAEILLGTLGFPIFEPPANRAPDAEHTAFCKRGGADARCVHNEERFGVLKGRSRGET